MIAEDRHYDLAAIADAEQVQVQSGGGLDQNLFNQLKELRKK
jgi:ATP-dependent DNA helicase RecQ